jgi:HAMP domain-containing protein
MSNRSSELRPFRVEIPQEALDDLRDRLDRVRWTTEVPGPGGVRGAGGRRPQAGQVLAGRL